MSTKRIVCLANSRKLHGRCIAGVEIVDGDAAGWVRPVSSREHGEVSENERQYSDGSDPRVLDVIDVPLVKAHPWTYQQENWLLDPGSYWERVGHATWDDLDQLTEAVAALWVDGFSTYNGENDKIPISMTLAIGSSLALVHVNRVRLAVFAPGEAFGNSKRRVQAWFENAGTDYRLWVTDPDYERRYLAQPDGYYDLGQCYLTVSLGEPFRDDCHKLVAAIIEWHETG